MGKDIALLAAGSLAALALVHGLDAGDRDLVALGDEIVFRVQGNRAVLTRTRDLLSLAGSISVPARARNVAWDEVLRRTRAARADERR